MRLQHVHEACYENFCRPELFKITNSIEHNWKCDVFRPLHCLQHMMDNRQLEIGYNYRFFFVF